MIDDSWYVRTSGLVEVTSAGGVVLRTDGVTRLVALITELDHPHYVLPKGHVEPGESLEAAARREVGEEAGLHDLRLIRPLGSRRRQNFERTKWKTIHYFLYTSEEIEFNPIEGDKHPDARWFPLDSLPTMFWPDQRELLVEVQQRLNELGPAFLL
jgi:ADP-ribose pyrophosphatase YjhB (NUDIX family)